MLATETTMPLEEIKLLQGIIAKQDDLRSQVFNWCVSLIGGIAVAFLSGSLRLKWWGFLGLSLLILVWFLWISVIHKVAQDRAIRRVREIEEQIRWNRRYDGPLIGKTLGQPNRPRDQGVSFLNVRVWGPYSALVPLVIAVAFFTAHPTERSFGDRLFGVNYRDR